MKRSVANANIPAPAKRRLLDRYSTPVVTIDLTDEPIQDPKEEERDDGFEGSGNIVEVDGIPDEASSEEDDQVNDECSGCELLGYDCSRCAAAKGCWSVMLMKAEPTEKTNAEYVAIKLPFSDEKELSASVVKQKMNQLSGVEDVKRFRCVGWRRNLQSSQEADKMVTAVLVYIMILAHKQKVKVSVVNQQTLLDQGNLWECVEMLLCESNLRLIDRPSKYSMKVGDLSREVFLKYDRNTAEVEEGRPTIYHMYHPSSKGIYIGFKNASNKNALLERPIADHHVDRKGDRTMARLLPAFGRDDKKIAYVQPVSGIKPKSVETLFLIGFHYGRFRKYIDIRLLNKKTSNYLANPSIWFYGFSRVVEFMFERKPKIKKIDKTREVINCMCNFNFDVWSKMSRAATRRDEY